MSILLPPPLNLIEGHPLAVEIVVLKSSRLIDQIFIHLSLRDERHSLVTAISVAATWSLQGTLGVDPSIAIKASIALDTLKATTPFTTRHASNTTPKLETLKAAILAGNYTSRASNLTRSRCPRSCIDAGIGTDKWYSYHNVGRLALCNDTMLLDFSLFNSLDDPSTHIVSNIPRSKNCQQVDSRAEISALGFAFSPKLHYFGTISLLSQTSK